MSRWWHTLCAACYADREPDREPHLVRDQEPEHCCRCGGIADPPINYRSEPDAFPCRGQHGDDAT